jgi:hypothetical protein
VAGGIDAGGKADDGAVEVVDGGLAVGVAAGVGKGVWNHHGYVSVCVEESLQL